jgi:hypothetical protein
MHTPSTTFAQFLSRFPVVELPVILNEETHFTFSEKNEPLNSPMIQQFILPLETDEPDELTEYIACFKLPNTAEFHAIVFWKAALLNYTYTLATFSKKGVYIDHRTIAGTYVDQQKITISVATINEEHEIYIASGQSGTNDEGYDAHSSSTYELELLPDGQIVNNY